MPAEALAAEPLPPSAMAAPAAAASSATVKRGRSGLLRALGASGSACFCFALEGRMEGGAGRSQQMIKMTERQGGLRSSQLWPASDLAAKLEIPCTPTCLLPSQAPLPAHLLGSGLRLGHRGGLSGLSGLSRGGRRRCGRLGCGLGNGSRHIGGHNGDHRLGGGLLGLGGRSLGLHSRARGSRRAWVTAVSATMSRFGGAPRRSYVYSTRSFNSWMVLTLGRVRQHSKTRSMGACRP